VGRHPLPLSLHLSDLFHLQDRLSEVITLEHSHKRLSCVLHASRLVDLGLETAILQPLLHILLVILSVLRSHIRIANHEASHGQTFRDSLE